MLRLTILAALLLPAPLLAQTAQSPASTIPASLATALREGAPGTRYFVDALPVDWPASVPLPRDARVVGGMSDTKEQVAVLEISSPAALAAFDSAFEAAGFHHPVLPLHPGFQGTPQSLTYRCRDSAFVSASAVAGANGQPYARVRYLERGTRGCTASRAPTVTTVSVTSALQLPLLQPPEGGHTMGGGLQTGSDNVVSQATLTATKLATAQVLDHYAKQLVSAGWTSAPAAVSGHVAVQPFDARDGKGDTWSGALMVVSHGGEHELTLNMHKVTP